MTPKADGINTLTYWLVTSPTQLLTLDGFCIHFNEREKEWLRILGG
jgi:hypothetical protein